MTTALSSNLLMQAIRSIIPLGMLRDGEVIEARVNAMLSRGVARLTLLGATLDVDTPVQLVAGSTIKVAIERSTDGLRLLLQRDGTGTSMAGSQQGSQEDSGVGGFRSLSLTIAQVAIDSALNAAVAASSQAPESFAVPASQTNAEQATKDAAFDQPPALQIKSWPNNPVPNTMQYGPSLAQPADGRLARHSSLLLDIAQATIDTWVNAAEPVLSQSVENSSIVAGQSNLQQETKETRSAQQPPPTAHSGFDDAAANAPQRRGSAATTSQTRETSFMRLSTEPPDSGRSPMTTPAPAALSNLSTIAYLPPGASEPFNLTFIREDDKGQGAGRSEASGAAWTVRFSFDSAGLGPLHAAIRLSGGGIGVKIWAERPGIAAALEHDSAELRDSLQEAAINIEAVAVLPGRPPSQNSGSTGLHSARTI
jgi:hypothetical protein